MESSEPSTEQTSAPEERNKVEVVEDVHVPRLDGPLISRYRAMTHLAVISALLLPIAIIPYALSRRRMTHLSRQVTGLTASVRLLQSELKTASGEISRRKDDQKRLRTILHNISQDLDELQFKGKVHSEQLAYLSSSAEQRVEHRDREIGKVKDDLWRLLEESHRKRFETAVLAGLGTSLADIAAFMHEVELEMGMPPPRGQDGSRGIDRLRKLAVEIGQLDKSKDDGLEAPVKKS